MSVNHFYLKGIESSRDVKVSYVTFPMINDQEMLVVSLDFRTYGVTLKELEFFPRGVVLVFSKISELPTEVFNNVVKELTGCKWDFAYCADPFAIVVQGSPQMYKRKNRNK